MARGSGSPTFFGTGALHVPPLPPPPLVERTWEPPAVSAGSGCSGVLVALQQAAQNTKRAAATRRAMAVKALAPGQLVLAPSTASSDRDTMLACFECGEAATGGFPRGAAAACGC